MSAITLWVCRATYFVCPILSIGSIFWFALVSDAGWMARGLLTTVCFFGFGFLGMFAGGIAKQIEDSRGSRSWR
jgi:hypothetical protein